MIRKPLGFQKIADLSASTALTVPAGARLALIQCESQDVRWRDDGTAPAADSGMLLKQITANDGEIMTYVGDLSVLRFIETAGGATLNALYYA